MKIFVSREGQQSGPYTVEEINARLRAGELTLQDWAWMEGASDWVPLESIAEIGGTAPAAPVAAKPQNSGTPSAKPSGMKPKSRFDLTSAFLISALVILMVVGVCKEGGREVVGPLKELGGRFMLLLFFVVGVWYLFRHQTKGVKLTYSRLERNREQELEQMRERVRQKMERLVSDGAPYIEGQIVRLVGVSGLATGACAIRFETSHANLFLAHGKALTLPYKDIQLLQIGGKGSVTESVDAGFIGGGFGLEGALTGIAEATFLNAAVSALTRKERVECELFMKWTTGELLMLNHEHTPEIVSHVLQPIIAKLG